VTSPHVTDRHVTERAFAKLNLVLHVGPPRSDGLHPLASILASIDLADELRVCSARSGGDSVTCPGVAAPNLVAAALAAFRERVPSLPPLAVRVEKRIPVAAGLGGGSADAAATLRAANRIAGSPLEVSELRDIAATLGSDVPSQVEPRHALVHGVGELVDPVELGGPLAFLLVPQGEGLSTAEVYAQLDRQEGWRDMLDHRALARATSGREHSDPDPGGQRDHPAGHADLIARLLENDLQGAALALRPELATVLDRLRRAGALGALVSGSGPTCFGLFGRRVEAESARASFPGSIVAELRGS
jgi:4-diphosphocytidyl-2-C-methyl-D-erythritol kinase